MANYTSAFRSPLPLRWFYPNLFEYHFYLQATEQREEKVIAWLSKSAYTACRRENGSGSSKLGSSTESALPVAAYLAVQ